MRRLVVIVFLLALVAPAPAVARFHISSHRWQPVVAHHKAHKRISHKHKTPTAHGSNAPTARAHAPAGAVSGPVAVKTPMSVPYQAPLVAATTEGDCLNGSDPGPWARAHGASIIKVGIPDYDNPAWNIEGCLNQARAEGLRIWIDIVIPRDGRPLPDDVAWVDAEIDRFASYDPWAVSIGNEQELGQVTMSGQTYRQVWDMTEPHLAQQSPDAIPVFGETSPCGGCLAFIKAAWGSSRPIGVKAIGYHFYNVIGPGGLADMPAIGAWAQSVGVQLWDSEASPAASVGHGFLVVQSVAAYEDYLKQQIERTPGGVPVVDKYLWPWIGGVN